MASIISTAAHAAHSVATSILTRAPIQVGQNVPVAEVKEDSPDKSERLVLKGKNILVMTFFFRCHLLLTTLL